MSKLKFDFSDVKLIKMPDEKKPALKKFKKPKFKPAPVNESILKPVPEIVTLSDSEDSKDHVQIIEEPVDIINITESSSSEDDSENENPSVEVITLDDSDSFCNSHPTTLKVKEALDYIPVPNCLSNKFTVNLKKRKKLSECMKVKPKKPRTPVLKLSKSNILVGSNKKTTGLRPVVIDGANVGCGYGNGSFNINGVIIVIKYFISRGHTEITCFLPAHYRNSKRTPIESQIINVYEKDGFISYTPSRKLMGKSITPYDDRFIVQYASEFGGVIISNDGYRDICQEEPSWLETVQNRLINYTFVKDTFMLPKDPLGPNGPSLDDMLKFS